MKILVVCNFICFKNNNFKKEDILIIFQLFYIKNSNHTIKIKCLENK